MAAIMTERESPTAAVARLEPVIRENAEANERGHRLAQPIVEAMRHEGLFRMLTPRSLGGTEADPLDYLETLEGISRIDGSTGWCLFIGAGGTSIGAFLPDETAEEVFGDPDTIAGGAVFPPGRALAADGGFRYSGHWNFASGCQHTKWLLAFGQTFDGEQVRLNAMGAPEMRFAVFPTREARIIENWDVSGLVGTGSHDFVLEDQFVPVRRTAVPMPGMRGGHYQGANYQLPFLANFGWPIAGVALGIAQASIDACRDLAAGKVPRLSDSTLAKKPLFQYQLADALAMVSSARAWVRFEWRSMLDTVARGEGVGLPARAVAGLAASHAVRSSAAAVNLMYTAGGGTSNFRSSPLQQQLRDIHAVTQHIVTSPQSIENAGRVLVGEPAPNPLIYL